MSVRLIRSPLLVDAGLVHGFSTRLGGVSTGRYESLNVGGKWGDDPAAVGRNRELLAADGGFALPSLCTARQVHGADVVVVDGPVEVDADALCTTTATVGVYTADCVPILVGDKHGRVAAAHAGWRGTVAEIAVRTVEKLVELGARREELYAAIGPSICVKCFEVGAEVAAEFRRWPDAVAVNLGDKPHVDLWSVNRGQLFSAGIPEAQIDARTLCTHCDPIRFSPSVAMVPASANTSASSPQGTERRLKVGGRLRAPAHGDARMRVRKAEHMGVQRLPSERLTDGTQRQIARRLAILPVADERVAGVFEVHPNLVRAAVSSRASTSVQPGKRSLTSQWVIAFLPLPTREENFLRSRGSRP